MNCIFLTKLRKGQYPQLNQCTNGNILPNKCKLDRITGDFCVRPTARPTWSLEKQSKALGGETILSIQVSAEKDEAIDNMDLTLF